MVCTIGPPNPLKCDTRKSILCNERLKLRFREKAFYARLSRFENWFNFPSVLVNFSCSESARTVKNKRIPVRLAWDYH
jgi:hypothetical protein